MSSPKNDVLVNMCNDIYTNMSNPMPEIQLAGNATKAITEHFVVIFGKNVPVFAIVLCVIILIVGIYFIWKYYFSASPSIVSVTKMPEQVPDSISLSSSESSDNTSIQSDKKEPVKN
jgi:hypothetical protein